MISNFRIYDKHSSLNSVASIWVKYIFTWYERNRKKNPLTTGKVTKFCHRCIKTLHHPKFIYNFQFIEKYICSVFILHNLYMKKCLSNESNIVTIFNIEYQKNRKWKIIVCFAQKILGRMNSLFPYWIAKSSRKGTEYQARRVYLVRPSENQA